jgi:hypothetical protein
MHHPVPVEHTTGAVSGPPTLENMWVDNSLTVHTELTSHIHSKRLKVKPALKTKSTDSPVPNANTESSESNCCATFKMWNANVLLRTDSGSSTRGVQTEFDQNNHDLKTELEAVKAQLKISEESYFELAAWIKLDWVESEEWAYT